LQQSCERAVIADQQAAASLSTAYSNHRVSGSPFCVTYISDARIIEGVRLREMWKTEAADVDVDFTLALYVVPYPNGLSVVWLALALFGYIQAGAHPL
jgi:hypothetical protein